MNEKGYDLSRFPSQINVQFVCPLCTLVARLPKECSFCGAMYCSSCIETSILKKPECVKCGCDTRKNQISRISGALLIMYNNLDIKCKYPQCNKLKKLIEIEDHENGCQIAKCSNFENCNSNVKPEFKDKGVCDLPCLFIAKIKAENGNMANIYNELKVFLKANYVPINSGVVIQPQKNKLPVFQNQNNNVNGSFRWDMGAMGAGIELSEGNTKVFLRESAYMFRTVLGDQPFTSGINYWEIVALPETENELKIGIVTKKNFNYNSAFCDYEFGYAYYGLGQLRQNSNASGTNYGKRFKKTGVLGICLNMNKGTLSFALDNEQWGPAFTSDSLRRGPIYAAISLLHCAGCKLVSNKPCPEYFLE